MHKILKITTNQNQQYVNWEYIMTKEVLFLEYKVVLIFRMNQYSSFCQQIKRKKPIWLSELHTASINNNNSNKPQ